MTRGSRLIKGYLTFTKSDSYLVTVLECSLNPEKTWKGFYQSDAHTTRKRCFDAQT